MRIFQVSRALFVLVGRDTTLNFISFQMAFEMKNTYAFWAKSCFTEQNKDSALICLVVSECQADVARTQGTWPQVQGHELITLDAYGGHRSAASVVTFAPLRLHLDWMLLTVVWWIECRGRRGRRLCQWHSHGTIEPDVCSFLDTPAPALPAAGVENRLRPSSPLGPDFYSLRPSLLVLLTSNKTRALMSHRYCEDIDLCIQTCCTLWPLTETSAVNVTESSSNFFVWTENQKNWIEEI